MKTHIPAPGDQLTLCGRRIRGKATSDGSIRIWVTAEQCIDTRTTAVDNATCQVCHRVDDARAAARWRRDLSERASAGDLGATLECLDHNIPFRKGAS